MWENDSFSFLQNKVIYILKPLNKNSFLRKELTKYMKHMNALNFENKRTDL